jgi:hypothetical protein
MILSKVDDQPIFVVGFAEAGRVSRSSSLEPTRKVQTSYTVKNHQGGWQCNGGEYPGILPGSRR